ncbi:MAG: hypothetical protein MJB12_09445 [Firmicutes bacterium]|nr:hypothetical protein [Bacillota bacterium]
MLGAHNSSNAYKYQEQEYYHIPQQPPKKRRKQKKNPAPAKHVNKFKPILGILVCFAVTFFIMLRYVAITEASNTVSSYKRDLHQLQRANEQMQVRLDSSIDLSKIEDIAKNELGMSEPKTYQMVPVTLNKNDYSEIVETQCDASGQRGSFALFLSKISNVLEYLY